MAVIQYLDKHGLKTLVEQLKTEIQETSGKIWRGTLEEWKALDEEERLEYDQAEIHREKPEDEEPLAAVEVGVVVNNRFIPVFSPPSEGEWPEGTDELLEALKTAVDELKESDEQQAADIEELLAVAGEASEHQMKKLASPLATEKVQASTVEEALQKLAELADEENVPSGLEETLDELTGKIVELENKLADLEENGIDTSSKLATPAWLCIQRDCSPTTGAIINAGSLGPFSWQDNDGVTNPGGSSINGLTEAGGDTNGRYRWYKLTNSPYKTIVYTPDAPNFVMQVTYKVTGDGSRSITLSHGAILLDSVPISGPTVGIAKFVVKDLPLSDEPLLLSETGGQVYVGDVYINYIPMEA